MVMRWIVSARLHVGRGVDRVPVLEFAACAQELHLQSSSMRRLTIQERRAALYLLPTDRNAWFWVPDEHATVDDHPCRAYICAICNCDFIYDDMPRWACLDRLDPDTYWHPWRECGPPC